MKYSVRLALALDSVRLVRSISVLNYNTELIEYNVISL